MNMEWARSPSKDTVFSEHFPTQGAEEEGWEGEQIIKMCHSHKVLLE